MTNSQNFSYALTVALRYLNAFIICAFKLKMKLLESPWVYILGNALCGPDATDYRCYTQKS